MNPEIRPLANTQHGLVTRYQALEAGYTERRLKTLLQPGGSWVGVRRGVYAERWEWDQADEARRHLLRVVAATMTTNGLYVLSHTSAAVVHGLACRPFWCELVHMSHPGVRGGRTEGGVKHHPAAVPEDQIVQIGDLAVTSLERTGVDIAREYGVEDGVVACDQVLNRGGRRSAMKDVLAQMWSWPYVTHARTAVDLADGGAENIAESLARMLVIELGYGKPETQVWIEDGGRRAQSTSTSVGTSSSSTVGSSTSGRRTVALPKTLSGFSGTRSCEKTGCDPLVSGSRGSSGPTCSGRRGALPFGGWSGSTLRPWRGVLNDQRLDSSYVLDGVVDAVAP